jgi:hypothetical protein
VGTRRGKLLQRRIDSATPTAVDTRAAVRAARHAPTVYWSVSPLRTSVSPVRNPPSALDLLQKKYVLSLKVCSSLGKTLNYWVDWHLLKFAQPARL